MSVVRNSTCSKDKLLEQEEVMNRNEMNQYYINLNVNNLIYNIMFQRMVNNKTGLSQLLLPSHLPVHNYNFSR